MLVFWHRQWIFEWTYLGDYFELGRLPQHSSDVFFHGELISDGFRGVRTLYASIAMGQSQSRASELCCVADEASAGLNVSRLDPQQKVACEPNMPIQKRWVCEVRVPTWPVIRTPFESPLTSSSRNRCIECPDASKTIGNPLPMKKYVGAVVRKSLQLK